VCSFFTACYFAADFERAGSWAALLRRHGLISHEPGGPIFLSSHCDSVQATLLVELGRWGEAEALLTRAAADFEATMSVPSWHPDIALADLRVRQGRFSEAEALLLGKDQAMQALLPTARLHLARGDHELARVAALRGLRAMGEDRLRSIELLEVLVDAELARGDANAAAAACAELAERAGGLDIPVLQVRAAAAQARVLTASGALTDALDLLAPVVERLDVGEHPHLHCQALLELTRLRDRAGDAAGAAIDARAARAVLATLDVHLPPDDVALLERLGRPPRRDHGAAPGAAVLSRSGAWWVATHAGVTVRLQDTKGLRYLAALVSCPGVEQHSLDLVDRVEGLGPADGPARRALGDAGEVLDARARIAYRHRIEQLRAEADEALAAGLLDAAEAHEAELDQLVAQLAEAFGIGGRSRRAASAAERARLNVTRALRAALTKLADALPGAGDVLARRVRTGLFCAYEPAEGDDVRWIVQSAMNEMASR
jgi:hypothetical protein